MSVSEVLHELGELAITRLRWDEACVHLREAESSYAATAESDYPPLARTRIALARALAGAAGLPSAEVRGPTKDAM